MMIFPFFIHFRLSFLKDIWGLSDAFHVIFVYAWLVMGGGEGGGREPERGIIEVLASVYVCVWVSISLFPHTHNSKQPQFLHQFSFPLPLSLSIFSPHSLPLAHRSTIQVSPNWTCPPFTFPPPCCLSIHLPSFTLLPVFVLQSGSWRGPSGHGREGKPVRWSAAGRSSEARKKERLWCGAGFRIFHRNAKTQTSEQASFIRKKFAPNGHTVQQHTEYELEELWKLLTVWLTLLSVFFSVSVCACFQVIKVTKSNSHSRFHMSAGSSVCRRQVSDNYPLPWRRLTVHKHIIAHTAAPIRPLTLEYEVRPTLPLSHFTSF